MRRLLLVQRNDERPQVWESGALARLNTLRDGMVQGLAFAGFERNYKLNSRTMVMQKNGTTMKIWLMTEMEYRESDL